ncbi:MAG TPA: tripartite tricarboxylate transporter substrate binding protein [Burkholderiales bacterium]|nr:tripartite tricarboxylate transporter substrate binding protein [Burkholderiales bacterium]
MKRRDFVQGSLGLTLVSAWKPLLAAEPYPGGPVKIIVASTPGTVMDASARICGKQLEPTWKQPVVVVNQAGAGGAIGTDQVAKAKPDGLTLLVAHEGILCVQPLLAKQDRPRSDIRAVAPLVEIELLVVANRDTGIRTMKELIAEAKARPGKLTYASAGVGTPVHLRTEILKQRAGIDIVHVPYKSVAAGMTDLVGGQVNVMLVGVSTAMPFMRDKLNVLATCGPKRNPLLPEVPTLSETIPGLAFTTWFALFAPAETPAELVSFIARDFTSAIRSGPAAKALTDQGIIPTGGGPDDLEAIVQRDFNDYSKVIKSLNLT